MEWWHLTLSSRRRAVLFSSEESRRRAVRLIVRVACDCVLLFCIVDDHVHVVILCARSRLRSIRGALVQALARAGGEPLVAHVQRVESRAHLLRLVRYVLTQARHHGLDVHPATSCGSCFQDLVGARCISECARRLAQELPRLRQSDLLGIVALPPRLEPADTVAVRHAGAARIVQASAAALAVGPALATRAPAVVMARRASVHVAESAGVARAELAWALGITPQRVGQLHTEPVGERLVRAVRLQIVLENLTAR